nr:high-affinity fructose transporter ght6 [Quercus suber]
MCAAHQPVQTVRGNSDQLRPVRGAYDVNLYFAGAVAALQQHWFAPPLRHHRGARCPAVSSIANPGHERCNDDDDDDDDDEVVPVEQPQVDTAATPRRRRVTNHRQMSSKTSSQPHLGLWRLVEDGSVELRHFKILYHRPVKPLLLSDLLIPACDPSSLTCIALYICQSVTRWISGFLEMDNFLQRFHSTGDNVNNYAFSDVRSGTIVGLLSIGTLIGALLSAPVADIFGRRTCIVKTAWYHFALGRWVAGLGVGALSVLTPMYMSETGPRQIRGALVSTYQLFITLGIFLADCINFGTETNPTALSWRLPIGIGFIWPVLMVTGVLFLPESPRWNYRRGKVEQARETISKSYGVPSNHWEVNREMREIKEKFDAENAGGGKHKFYEVLTGPRMAYRVALGVTLQALQQLTGANFFFYYGTSIFQGVAINAYVTAMILGGVNFGMTFFGLYVVDRFGRRKALITGGLWMFVCLLIFSSVGHFALDRDDPMTTPQASVAMIVFACLFLVGYATTWGPIVWAVIGEMFPTRYRAQAMGISSASNWTWNFLISFFTPFITSAIDFRYGYVFAACNFAGAVVVYFFLCEHQGRSLEEIDTMYITHVSPMKSSKWKAPEGEDLVTADSLYLEPGARGIRKSDAAGMESTEQRNEVPAATEQHGVHDVSGTEYEPQAAGVRGGSIS